MHKSEKWKWSRSVVSDPQRPYGLQPSRLLHARNFPGKSTGVGCRYLLQKPYEVDILIISILKTFSFILFPFWKSVAPKQEKEMAPHSNTLAWKIPWAEEPVRLQSMWSWRVGHDWVTSLSLFTFMHWRRKWQPTPVFLPGESEGVGSLVGCHLWGCTEADTTEATLQQQQQQLQNIMMNIFWSSCW